MGQIKTDKNSLWSATISISPSPSPYHQTDLHKQEEKYSAHTFNVYEMWTGRESLRGAFKGLAYVSL